MREIEFRGRVPESDELHGGEVHFGTLVIYKEPFGGSTHWIIPLDDYRGYPVERETVAQLINVDVNGNKVYEGDKVIRIRGDEDFEPEKTFPMCATFEDYAAIRDGEIVLIEAVGNPAVENIRRQIS